MKLNDQVEERSNKAEEDVQMHYKHREKYKLDVMTTTY